MTKEGEIELQDLDVFWRGRAKALRLVHAEQALSEATLRVADTYETCADEIKTALTRAPAQGWDACRDIRWQRVNDEPFEYAIQQGPHGDAFVKLLNGMCLRRPLSPAPATTGDGAEAIAQLLKLLSELTPRTSFYRLHGIEHEVKYYQMRFEPEERDKFIAALAHSQSPAETRAPEGANPLLKITYTNYRGETSERTIAPRSIRFGSTEWHPEPQWLLLAFDTDKGADREFAIKDFGENVTNVREREKKLLAEKLQDKKDLYDYCVRAETAEEKLAQTVVLVEGARLSTIEECAKVAAKQIYGWVNGAATTAVGQAYQRGCTDAAVAIRALALTSTEQASKDLK